MSVNTYLVFGSLWNIKISRSNYTTCEKKKTVKSPVLDERTLLTVTSSFSTFLCELPIQPGAHVCWSPVPDGSGRNENIETRPLNWSSSEVKKYMFNFCHYPTEYNVPKWNYLLTSRIVPQDAWTVDRKNDEKQFINDTRSKVNWVLDYNPSNSLNRSSVSKREIK